MKVRPTPARQFRRTAQVELSCDRLIQHGQHPTTDGFNVTIRIQQKNPTTTKIQFVLPDDIHEGAVSAVGSFNQWQPGVHRLVKRSNGTRSVSVDVPKGEEIKFRYLGDGGVWFDDPDADVITNEGALVRA